MLALTLDFFLPQRLCDVVGAVHVLTSADSISKMMFPSVAQCWYTAEGKRGKTLRNAVH